MAIVKSRALLGMNAPPVFVEAHLAQGLPGFTIVGLPEAEVKESRERVRAALQSCGFEFPARRITVNLAPADLRKESGRYDLPIALGILAANGHIPYAALNDYEFAGELSLSGKLLPVRGALAMSYAIAKQIKNPAQPTHFILPTACAREAALIPGLKVFPADGLLDVCKHLHQTALLSPQPSIIYDPSRAKINSGDLRDIRGQFAARRSLEIAAAGGHSLLLLGPPGSGKTMLANRLLSILPVMTQDEALELAALNDLAGIAFKSESWLYRPFRAPHHSISRSALIGGGTIPKPGEISLAHHGVLFLDEFPEFSRQALEGLREPLQSGTISIARTVRQVDFLAKFQLVAAMNPCPCGYFGHAAQNCQCTKPAVRAYQMRISAPLLDRIDMRVWTPALTAQELLALPSGENSEQVAQRVSQARERQLQRQSKINRDLSIDELSAFCMLQEGEQKILQQAQGHFHHSARAIHRILRLARTIADLSGDNTIQCIHLSEAMQYQRAGFLQATYQHG